MGEVVRGHFPPKASAENTLSFYMAPVVELSRRKPASRLRRLGRALEQITIGPALESDLRVSSAISSGDFTGLSEQERQRAENYQELLKRRLLAPSLAEASKEEEEKR